MERVNQVLWFAALGLVCAGSVLSQNTDSPNRQAKVTVQHTNERGVLITTIKLNPILIQHDEATNSYTLLTVSVTYEDKSPQAKVASLFFHARSPSCRFSNKSNLILALDNDTITIASALNKTGDGGLWVFSEPAGNVCSESCSALISEQTFQRMTKSKRVEARLGDVTLTPDDFALNALRDFAVYIAKSKRAV